MPRAKCVRGLAVSGALSGRLVRLRVLWVVGLARSFAVPSRVRPKGPVEPSSSV